MNLTHSLPIYQADAFTENKFGGNPAAVCLLEQDLENEIRQKIAAEMNLAETAYLEKVDESKDFVSGDKFKLRWFTPAVEVPLCGHATLASGAVLMKMVGNLNKKITFATLSGDLTVELLEEQSENGNPLFRMQLPICEPNSNSVPAGINANHPLILATLGNTYLPLVEDIVFDETLQYLLVVLKSEVTQEQLESIQPDFQQMFKSVEDGVLRAVCVTCQGQGGVDVLSRFFTPWCGIDEDPVTGSAHAVLAPYWSKKIGTQSLTARQCSKRQGNLLMTMDMENGIVKIDASCALVMKAELLMD